jgi:dTDP-4-amino-4,6-dideoxygalactose transaminase
MVERYTAIGGAGEILPDSSLFRSLDARGLGGPVGEALANFRRLEHADLPVTRRLARQLVALPPLTKVSEKYLRQCVKGLRKVADAARSIQDVRRA